MEVQNIVEPTALVQVKTEIEDEDVVAANVTASSELVKSIKTEDEGFSNNVDLTIIPLGTEGSNELKRKYSHDESKDGSKKIKDCSASESQVQVGSSEEARKFNFLKHYECTECPFNSQRQIDITRHMENHFRTTKFELHDKDKSIQNKAISETPAILNNNINGENDEENKHDTSSLIRESVGKLDGTLCNNVPIEQIKNEEEEEETPASSNNNNNVHNEENSRASNLYRWFKCMAQGCPYKTNTLHSFKRHQHNHNHKGRLKCRYCSFSCKSNGILTLHLMEHVEAQTTISVPPISEKKYFNCNVDDCPYTTNNYPQLKRHQFYHECNEALKCPHCSLICEGQEQWKLHLKEHDSKITSADKATFIPEEIQQTRRKALLSFKKCFKYDKKSRQNYYQCSDCPFKSTLKKNFLTHALKHKSAAGKKCFYCTFRGTSQEVKLHKLIHKKKSFKKPRAAITEDFHIDRGRCDFSKACSSNNEATKQSKSDIMAVILKEKSSDKYNDVFLPNMGCSVDNVRKLQPAHLTSENKLQSSDNESQDNIKAVIVDGECCFINNATKTKNDNNHNQETSEKLNDETSLKATIENYDDDDDDDKHNHKITITITASKENNDADVLKSALAEIFKSLESAKLNNDSENEPKKNGSTEMADILNPFNIHNQEDGNLEKNKSKSLDSREIVDAQEENHNNNNKANNILTEPGIFDDVGTEGTQLLNSNYDDKQLNLVLKDTNVIEFSQNDVKQLQEPINKISPVFTLSKPEIFEDIEYEGLLILNKSNNVQKYAKKCETMIQIDSKKEHFSLNGNLHSLAEKEPCNSSAESEIIDVQEYKEASNMCTISKPLIFDNIQCEKPESSNEENVGTQKLNIIHQYKKKRNLNGFKETNLVLNEINMQSVESPSAIDIQAPDVDISNNTYTLLQPMSFDRSEIFSDKLEDYCNEENAFNDIDIQGICNGDGRRTPTIFDDFETLFVTRDIQDCFEDSNLFIENGSKTFSFSDEQGEAHQANDSSHIAEVDHNRCDLNPSNDENTAFNNNVPNLNNISKGDELNDNNSNVANIEANKQGTLELSEDYIKSTVSSPLLEKTLKCEDCDCPFITHNTLNLKKHMKFHEGIGAFKCQYCTYSCKNQTRLTQHVGKHKAEISKSANGVKSVRRSKMQNCMYDECPFRTGILSVLKRHQLCHEQEARHKCYFCSFSCNTWTLLNEHIKLHSYDNLSNYSNEFQCIKIKVTGGESPSYKKIYLCKHCDYLNESLFCIRKHSQRHKIKSGVELLRCLSCLRKFNQKQHIDSHLKEHPECRAAAVGLECSLCSYRTEPGANNLMLHLQEHVVLNDGYFNCPFCDMKHTKKEAVLSHIRVVHHKYKEIIKKYQRKMSKSKVFRYKNIPLSDHKPIKKEEERIDQEIITKITRHIEEEKNGLESQHNSNQEQQDSNRETSTVFQCKYCPTKASNEGFFKYHLKNHFKTGGVQCLLCTYRTNKTEILEHILCHSVDKLHCPLCDTEKRNIENIVDHVKVVHSRAIFEKHDSVCRFLCKGTC